MIRARTFAADWGIPEDEANGSGAMRLASTLGKTLEIHHGKGSVIYARRANERFAEVGGRVVLA
jgi:predicted PhzF superfamily epimerase YddE/YHI9